MGQRGFFITFEGGEGSGKTTQCKRLAIDLEKAGYGILLTHEPGGTPISEQIRGILLNREHREMVSTTELLLFAAARAQHVSERIVPALDEGRIVISARFADSMVAYQGYARGLELELIHHLNRIATQGLTPDLTIVLDLPVEIGLERARQSRESMDRMESERIEFHKRLRDGFLTIACQEPDRIKVIDVQVNPDRVYEQIKAEVDRRINEKDNKWRN